MNRFVLAALALAACAGPRVESGGHAAPPPTPSASEAALVPSPSVRELLFDVRSGSELVRIDAPPERRASGPLLAPRPAERGALPRDPRGGDRALVRRVASTRLARLRLQGVESLSEAVRAVQVATGLPLVVDRRAEAASLEHGARFDLDLEHPLAARSALNLIAELGGPDVAWTVRNEVVLFTTRERARPDLVLAYHDVRMLVTPRRSFAGPEIGFVAPSGGLQGQENRFGGVELDNAHFDEEALIDLIRDNVSPATWEESGVSVRALNGVLVVRQTPAVQAAVRRLLAELGAF